MQWETKVRFTGQVKPAGIEKSMSWKMGSVHFDNDAVSGLWMAKLYFKVNPTKVCQQMKIGQSDNLDIKCGRLMIENKKGDGIHIRLSDSDIAHAKLLVSKIKNSTALTPASNRAVVGLPSNSTLSRHKGSENVDPFRSEDSNEWSLLHSGGDMSPERQVGGWLSKKTLPMKNRDCNPAPKRKLELFSPEKESWRKDSRNDQHSSTGMKDYSKRILHGGNRLSETNGLGAKNFYGAQNSLTTNNSYRNSHLDKRNLDRSPALKRLKLSSPVSIKRMADSKIGDDSKTCEDSTSQSVPGSSVTRTKEISGGDASESARQHRLGESETIGFQNLGNTCFLNSPLQCLSSLEPLTLDIQSAVAAYGSELSRNSITRKLYLLMKGVRKHDVCPEQVKEILVRLRNDMNVKFAPNTQQDAHELLSELLNRVDDEVKAAMRRFTAKPPVPATDSAVSLLTDLEMEQKAFIAEDTAGAAAEPQLSSASFSSPMEANFRWSYRTHIYFHECKSEVVSSQTEHETTLMLALDSSTRDIQDCINKYFESTEVQMNCEKCGKDEKATITRKIVKLPRVFILTLLRYHSENMESTKKADHIFIPSYISVYNYCSEDVRRPPHVEPIFMMDRIKTGKSLLPSRRPLNEISGKVHPAFNLPPMSTFVQDKDRRVIVQAERSHGYRPEDREIMVMMEFISCNLRTLDTYIEDHSSKENLADLHSLSEVLFEKTMSTLTDVYHDEMYFNVANAFSGFTNSTHLGKENDQFICGYLLKKVFNLEEHQCELLDDNLDSVISDLVMVRYSHIASMDYRYVCLMRHTAMYLAATQCGFLKTNIYEQKVTTNILRELLTPRSNRPIDINYDQGLTIETGSGDKSFTKGRTTRLRRTVSSRQVHFNIDDSLEEEDQDVYDHDDKVASKEESGTGSVNYSLSVSGGNRWTHDPLDESNSGERKIDSPDTSQMLHGKDINLYSEADLQKIDFDSLTEDEIMIYAQALSRFEYEKETGLQVESTHSITDEVKDVQISTGQDSLTKLDDSKVAEVVSETSSRMHPPVIIPDPREIFERSVESNLLCNENLTDLDETDGHGSKSRTAGLKQSCKASEPEFVQNLESSSDQNLESSSDRTLSCDSVLSTSSGLDHTEFDSHPLDMSHSALLGENIPSDVLINKKLSPSKDASDKSNSSSEDHSDLPIATTSIDDVAAAAAAAAYMSLHSPMDSFLGDTAEDAPSHSARMTEYLPSKKGNILKTRDYARLKSPASSPKKRASIGQQPKSISVSKRLHFSGNAKIGKSKSDPDGYESLSSEDCSGSEHNSSLEVNVDDESFLDSTNSYFVDPSALNISHSTPKLTSGTPCPSSNMTSSSRSEPSTSQSSSSSTDFNPSIATVCELTVNQESNMEVDQEVPVRSTMAKDSTSENIQEDVESPPPPPHTLNINFKPNRPVSCSTEEKENVYTDLGRAEREKDIQLGSAELSYKLVGLVDHTGNSQFTGHYTAYAFNMRKQKWFFLNDAETQLVTEEKVKKENTDTGYLFFYMDKDLFNEYKERSNAPPNSPI